MPLMPTALQSETSRRNGSLSRGPVTEAGKAASSMNALRHGLRGGGICVRPEESGWYAGLLDTHLHLYAPVNEAETGVVEQLCILELKLHRLDLLELTALDPAAEDESEKSRRLPSLATFARYRNRITKERWELEHRLTQLQHRRKSLGADAEAARQELRQEARTRALTSMALMGVLKSGVLTQQSESGTKEPDWATGAAHGTNEPEPAGVARGTDEPEAATPPLNRRQRRIMEKLARQKQARAGIARAA
jgi:hypothetical protein